MVYPNDPQAEDPEAPKQPNAAQQVGQAAADYAGQTVTNKARQAVGSFAANGAKTAGKFALQAAAKGIALIGEVLTAAAPYVAGVVVVAVVIILIVALIYHFSSHTSPAGIARSEIMVVGGDGFGESGSMYCLTPPPEGDSESLRDDPRNIVSQSPEENPAIYERGQEIADSLIPGYWNYYNHSLLYDDPSDPFDFYTDPDSETDRLNRDAYGGNSPNLFWCTYLIIRSYSEANHSWAPTSARSDLMMQEFCNRGKFVDAAKAYESQLVPGSVIFFHVLSGPSRVNHVAMVSSVVGGQVSFIQSNAGTISGSFPLGSTMLGSNMQIIGFGLP